jgi:hypothetical protein
LEQHHAVILEESNHPQERELLFRISKGSAWERLRVYLNDTVSNAVSIVVEKIFLVLLNRGLEIGVDIHVSTLIWSVKDTGRYAFALSLI